MSTYKNTTHSKSVDHYFFDGQIRKAQVQFAAIFSELLVKTGKNDHAGSEFITVPVKIGAADRVVAAILSGNTQNKAVRLPMITCQMVGMNQAFDFVKGSDTIVRQTEFPLGGTLPDDGKVVYKYMPFPYFLQMEVSLVATNEFQHQQMLEQVLLLFNPTLQIQISDGFQDWTCITHVELTDIGFEDPYGSDSDMRVLTSTLGFQVLAYLSPPINVRENYIKKIKMRISSINTGASINDFLMDDIPGPEDEYVTVADATAMDIPPR